MCKIDTKHVSVLIMTRGPKNHTLHTYTQIMTLEGWAEIMYISQATAGYASFIYFVALVFIGPIFAVQLFLVVISNKFSKIRLEENKQMEAHNAAKQLRTHQSSEVQHIASTPLPSTGFSLPTQTAPQAAQTTQTVCEAFEDSSCENTGGVQTPRVLKSHQRCQMACAPCEEKGACTLDTWATRVCRDAPRKDLDKELSPTCAARDANVGSCSEQQNLNEPTVQRLFSDVRKGSSFSHPACSSPVVDFDASDTENTDGPCAKIRDTDELQAEASSQALVMYGQNFGARSRSRSHANADGQRLEADNHPDCVCKACCCALSPESLSRIFHEDGATGSQSTLALGERVTNCSDCHVSTRLYVTGGLFGCTPLDVHVDGANRDTDIDTYRDSDRDNDRDRDRNRDLDRDRDRDRDRDNDLCTGDECDHDVSTGLSSSRVTVWNCKPAEMDKIITSKPQPGLNHSALSDDAHSRSTTLDRKGRRSSLFSNFSEDARGIAYTQQPKSSPKIDFAIDEPCANTTSRNRQGRRSLLRYAGISSGLPKDTDVEEQSTGKAGDSLMLAGHSPRGDGGARGGTVMLCVCLSAYVYVCDVFVSYMHIMCVYKPSKMRVCRYVLGVHARI